MPLTRVLRHRGSPRRTSRGDVLRPVVTPTSPPVLARYAPTRRTVRSGNASDPTRVVYAWDFRAPW